MVILIHVLCSNFTEVVRRELGETMRCSVTKTSQSAVFSASFSAHLAEGAKSIQGACPLTYVKYISTERVTSPYVSL